MICKRTLQHVKHKFVTAVLLLLLTIHQMVLWKNYINFPVGDRVSELMSEVSECIIKRKFVFSDPKTGHYPGAVNIPFPSVFNPDTKTLKTVDELKKGKKKYRKIK